jgi:hypothetical protein
MLSGATRIATASSYRLICKGYSTDESVDLTRWPHAAYCMLYRHADRTLQPQSRGLTSQIQKQNEYSEDSALLATLSSSSKQEPLALACVARECCPMLMAHRLPCDRYQTVRASLASVSIISPRKSSRGVMVITLPRR